MHQLTKYDYSFAFNRFFNSDDEALTDLRKSFQAIRDRCCQRIQEIQEKPKNMEEMKT
jgi:hypothetical protein